VLLYCLEGTGERAGEFAGACRDESLIFMEDLEPILNVLCNYYAGLALSADELTLLREWLEESAAHEDLFNDLNNRNGMQFILGSTYRNIREKIQMRLIEMEEAGN
jgi:hypothetical protein